ncbi:MAG: hypothetical protein WC716_08080 [Chitinophagaceae bacterium]|jgi:hypothetical protein
MKNKVTFLLLFIFLCSKSAFADINLDSEEMVLFITPYFIVFASLPIHLHTYVIQKGRVNNQLAIDSCGMTSGNIIFLT